jgi:hypothetical protein
VIPKADEALGFLSQGLMTTLFAEPHSMYTISEVSLVTLLLNAIAQEYNNGAEVRVRDIEEMQQLFKNAESKVSDSELVRRLAANLSERPASLEISELNDIHDRCSLLLIDLHAYVEELLPAEDPGGSGSWADSCNSNIWDFLERQAERHKIDTSI